MSDAHTGRPVLCEASADDEGGRGLRLVKELSTGWGVRERPHGIGKTVWAQVPLQPRI
ncbi:hypothetical protein ABZW18_09465 [Streptomyces sp. NPDC004647]|uniref:hypothetical protein n=1 Tax=Streptomyces sp. NPDC004647 TaxID=3154671 RepID=UPI0033AA7C19